MVCLKLRDSGPPELYVYFLVQEKEGDYPGLCPVERIADTLPDLPKRVKFVVEALLVGPTAEEAKKGISSAVPKTAKLLGVRKENEVVLLDFSQDIEKGGGTGLMEAMLAQIVFTATQFPDIAKVRILVENRRVQYLGGEGLLVEDPLSRSDFEDFIGGENEKGNSS